MLAETIIALTLVGEGANLGRIGMERIYSCLVNRAGSTDPELVAKECIKPYQFSCWANLPLMQRAKRDKGSLNLAYDIVRKKQTRAEIGHSRHYLAYWLYSSDQCPKWAKMGKVILNEGSKGHLFLEGVR